MVSHFVGICGHYDAIEHVHFVDTFPHPLNKWAPEERNERFVREAGRRQPRGDDPENTVARTDAGRTV